MLGKSHSTDEATDWKRTSTGSMGSHHEMSELVFVALLCR